jgi:hypothetical protein
MEGWGGGEWLPLKSRGVFFFFNRSPRAGGAGGEVGGEVGGGGNEESISASFPGLIETAKNARPLILKNRGEGGQLSKCRGTMIRE